MLNREQEVAVGEDGNCAVFAPPGSGKTTLLATKCARLVSLLPDDKQIVLAATFTREGASVLRKRVHAMLGSNRPILQSRFFAGTFHSLSISQLKAAGIKSRILSPQDQARYVAQAAARARYPISEDLPTPGEHLERCKGAMVYDHTKDAFPLLLEIYSEMLRSDSVIDLSDVLIRCVEGMRDEDSPIVPYPAFHMVLDETQDTDEVQFAWAREHHNAGTKITIVGDDDQTIYTWRRAAGYPGMRRFISYSGARTIHLVQNYRCRPEIVQSAGLLIAHNLNRAPKEVIAQREPGGKIFVVPCHTMKQEAEVVARVIDRSSAVSRVVRDNQPGEFGALRTVRDRSWAVIARSNAALRAVEKALAERGIPYFKNGKSIWNADPIHGVISLLLFPNSPVSVRSFMAGIGFRAEDIAFVISTISSFNKADSLKATAAIGALAGDAGGSLDAFLAALSKVQGFVRSSQLVFALSVLQGVVMKWFAKLAPGASRDDSLVWREIKPDYYDNQAAELEDLFETLSTVLANGGRDWRSRLLGLINNQSAGGETPVPAVQLLSMHSSKGMEFENVWIVGAHEGAMPVAKRPKIMDAVEFVEEERRLFYVGMTRAKDRLHVSFLVTKGPSIFLQEARLQDLATWVQLPDVKRRKRGEPQPGSIDALPDVALALMK